MSTLTINERVRAYSIRRAYEFQRHAQQARRQARQDRLWIDAARNSHLAAQDARVSHCPWCWVWRWDEYCRKCGRRTT